MAFNFSFFDVVVKNPHGKDFFSWEQVVGIHPRDVNPDLDFSAELKDHWKNAADILGYADFCGLSLKHIYQILAAFLREEVELGIERWGRISKWRLRSI